MKKIFLMILMVFMFSFLIACTNTNEKPDEPIIDVEVPGYAYEGTLTVAPYTAYNQDGSIIEEFSYLFDAIRVAGLTGKSSNITYVKDGNQLEVFKRQAKNIYHLYDGMHYVGSKPSADAILWSKSKMKSYAIDGQGIGFVNLGIDLFQGSEYPEHVELNAGGYNYMFSKHGEMTSGKWEKQGYGYASATVRLSEATYEAPKDGGQWNAYIFINHQGKFNIDLGLIGNLINGEVVWRLVRNSSHTDHKVTGDGFKVMSSEAVTKMTKNSDGSYGNADDLHFEVIATVDSWTLNITNLTTNKVHTIYEFHEGMHTESTGYFRFLLAASLVPVVGNVWNARNGAYLNNVIFEDVKIARFNSNNVYTDDMMEPFYPGEDNVSSGFSYGADTARHIFATHQADGTYKSGASYQKGNKYISYSAFYDGRDTVKWPK